MLVVLGQLCKHYCGIGVLVGRCILDQCILGPFPVTRQQAQKAPSMLIVPAFGVSKLIGNHDDKQYFTACKNCRCDTAAKRRLVKKEQ